MTITTLHDLLATWEAERQMDRDATQVSPSATNTFCRRQLAYGLTLTPETDEVEPVTMATVGSLLHWAIARLWEDDPTTIGTEVQCPGSGTADVVQGELDWDEDTGEVVGADPHTVRDTKSVARTKFDRWARNDGPPDEVWDQVMVYAGRLGAIRETVPHRWTVIIDAICRETGRTATWARFFDPEQYEAAEAGLANLQARYSTGDPDTAPADRDGRGDWVCDSCPWATRCLGEDQRPNVADLPEEEVAAAAAEYLRWNAIANEAEAKAKAARNLLRATDGTFGGYRVTWAQRSRHYAATEERDVPYSVIKVEEVQ